MVYLQVAHTDDNDCDLYRFDSLLQATKYIIEYGIVEYILSDQTDIYQADDFTLITDINLQ